MMNWLTSESSATRTLASHRKRSFDAALGALPSASWPIALLLPPALPAPFPVLLPSAVENGLLSVSLEFTLMDDMNGFISVR